LRAEIKERIEKIKKGEIPEGYKKTTVGIIPIVWNVKSLGDIIIKSEYGSSEPTNDSSGIPVLRMGNLLNGKISTKNLVYMQLTDDDLNRYRLENGDLLINRTNSYDLVGKVALFELEGDYICASYLVRFIINKEYADSKLVSYYMNLDNSQKYIKSLATKAIQQANINPTVLKKHFKLPLSSDISEQQRISAILSTWDKAIEIKEKLIEKKKEQKRGLMQALLIGTVRLPGFEGEWNEVKLGNVSKMNSGGTPNSSTAEYFNGNIPWVSIADMTKNGKYIINTDRCISELGLENSSAKVFPQGTVLYAMYASIGECSIAKIELCSSQAILGIRPKSNLNNEFLYYYLISIKEKLKLQGQQGTQSNLNADMVKKLSIFIPSLEEQLAIVEIFLKIDQSIDLLEQELSAIKLQKKGLMQLLLTGIVRVPN